MYDHDGLLLEPQSETEGWTCAEMQEWELNIFPVHFLLDHQLDLFVCGEGTAKTRARACLGLVKWASPVWRWRTRPWAGRRWRASGRSGRSASAPGRVYRNPPEPPTSAADRQDRIRPSLTQKCTLACICTLPKHDRGRFLCFLHEETSSTLRRCVTYRQRMKLLIKNVQQRSTVYVSEMTEETETERLWANQYQALNRWTHNRGSLGIHCICIRDIRASNGLESWGKCADGAELLYRSRRLSMLSTYIRWTSECVNDLEEAATCSFYAIHLRCNK